MREVVFRFIDAKEDAKALPQNADCAINIPRAAVFLPVQTTSTNVLGKS
jgi:hypothetical protein